MNARVRTGLAIACGVALSVAAATALVAAQENGPAAPVAVPVSETLPIGPEIDFCPSPDQSREHLERHGFDYKPTVPCNAEGEFTARRSDPNDVEYTADQLTKKERDEKGKARLLAATRVPDKDGDPRTIEGIDADGNEFTIVLDTSKPEIFEGMTFAELAEVIFP